MSLEIETFVLGPLENNTYLAADTITRKAVLIDPSFEVEQVLARADQLGRMIEQIWLTHAHFDHIAGVEKAAQTTQPPLPFGIHPADLDLLAIKGGAANFGFRLELTLQPSILFQHGQILRVGDETMEVRHTPGHSRGHVVFVSHSAGAVFCGDLIFQGSVGRTDLPGGSHETLMNSIRENILTLHPNTRLLSGHGNETTVGRELDFNPFLQ